MLTFSLECGPSYSYNDTMLDIMTSAVTDVMRTARWGAGMLPYCFPVIVTLSVMAPSVWVHTCIRQSTLTAWSAKPPPAHLASREVGQSFLLIPAFLRSPLSLLAPVPLPRLCPLPFPVSSHPGHLCLLTVLSVVCPSAHRL